MRKLLLLLSLIISAGNICAQDLTYYLPDSVPYNQSIPKPKDIIFHEVGEYHVTHDRLVNYMKAIAADDQYCRQCHFRTFSFWLGGTKLFMNAIFFGRIIDAASGKTE